MPRCSECRKYVSEGGHGHTPTCKSRNKPVGRARLSPAEAAKVRDLARRRAIAERERRQARIRRMLANRQQALLAAGPVANANRSVLDDVAFNIHNAYNWRGHGEECVTAVVHEAGGQRLVFPQRYMKAMQTYARLHYGNLLLTFRPGGGAHLHAEMYAVQYYLLLGQDPGQRIVSIGVSKPICPMCAAVLDHLGIDYTEGWITDDVSNNWINPWDQLPATCKPAVPRWHPGDDESDDDESEGGGGREIELTA